MRVCKKKGGKMCRSSRIDSIFMLMIVIVWYLFVLAKCRGSYFGILVFSLLLIFLFGEHNYLDVLLGATELSFLRNFIQFYISEFND